MKKSFLKYILITLLTTLMVINLHSQSCEEIQILETVPGIEMHEYGSSVDMDNDQFVIGAPGQEKCFLYQFSGGIWVETIIERSIPQQNDSYGFDVAIDGDRIVVAAPYDNSNGSNYGAIYVYDWDGSNWIETFLTPTNSSGFFGISVDLKGDRIVAGTEEDLIGFGSAHVFELVAGVWEETLFTQGTSTFGFGLSVAIKSDTILIGAPQSNEVFLYYWDGTEWVDEVITPSDGMGDNFGVSVSIDEGKFICGASYDNTNGDYGGSLYFYQKNGSTWDETKILPSDGIAFDFFGESISISGDFIVVGQIKSEAFTGKIYLFENTNGNWSETQLSASDGNLDDQFGFDVGVHNGKILTGARFVSDLGNNVGAA